MPSIRNTAAIVVVAAGSLLSQQNPDQPVVLKSTTRLVQINVVATGHHDEPVAGLTKSDFHIRVNGKEQPIQVFSVASNAALPGDSTAAARVSKPLGRGGAQVSEVSNRLSAAAGAASAVTVILLDSRNTKPTDLVYAKAQIIRYLRTLQPTDHIGIYTFGSTLRVLHDYTTDSSELLRRLTASKSNALPDTSKADPAGAMQMDAVMLDEWTRRAGRASAAEIGFYTTDRVFATLRAFEFIANHLAQVPGRKNLIWVSGGIPFEIGYDNIRQWQDPRIEHTDFTEEVARTMRFMENANVAVYPVDARGLMTDSRFDASRSRPAPLRPGALPAGYKEQQTMLEMAERTGGRAYYNTNDLTKAIQSAVDDSRITYTLGFYPADSTFDGGFRKIDVQVPGRGDLKLRYRKGYFDLPEEPQDERTRQVELHDAVWSPLDASAVGISATVRTLQSNPARLDISLQIDHRDISLQPGQDRWLGRLDILFVQRDDQGRQYEGRDDTMALDLGDENHQKLMTQDLAYHQVVTRDPKAKMLRIVVRDAASGAIGSVTVPLPNL